jgi:hypothetical protein
MKRAHIGDGLNFDLCDLQKVGQTVFCFGPLVAKLRIRSDWNLAQKVIWPRGTYVQSFRSIAPAVTKRAMFTDYDDGQYMIVKAHLRWAKNK